MKNQLSNRAVLISFHHYPPYFGEGYLILWKQFLKTLPLWHNEISTLYIIDSDIYFSDEDWKKLSKIHPKSKILKTLPNLGHWGTVKWALSQIDEENILLFDHDVLVNKSGVIDKWFSFIENGFDLVSAFDNSGGMREVIQNTFPFMKEHDVTRIGPYYSIFTHKLLKSIDNLDFAPVRFDEYQIHIPELNYNTTKEDWCDSFGLFTIKLLGKNPRIKIIEDPRYSIYLRQKENKWIIENDKNPINLGYYHIRNGNLANYVLTSFQMEEHKEDALREIKNNPTEVLRSLAWFYYMADDYDGSPLIELLKVMGLHYKQFLEYYDEFIKYHIL